MTGDLVLYIWVTGGPLLYATVMDGMVLYLAVMGGMVLYTIKPEWQPQEWLANLVVTAKASSLIIEECVSAA